MGHSLESISFYFQYLTGPLSHHFVDYTCYNFVVWNVKWEVTLLHRNRMKLKCSQKTDEDTTLTLPDDLSEMMPGFLKFNFRI